MMALSEQEKRFITKARRLEEALAIHGKTEGAHTEIRSEEMMRIALRHKIYPKEANWGFKQANWDNGAPIRKLVYGLNEKGLLKQVFPSCRFQKSYSRYEDNAYFFMPKLAHKRAKEKLKAISEQPSLQENNVTSTDHFSDALGLAGTLMVKLKSYIEKPNTKDAGEIQQILSSLKEFVDTTGGSNSE
jgi:hypothetical protein